MTPQKSDIINGRPLIRLYRPYSLSFITHSILRLKAHLETCNAKGAREIYQCGSCERNYLHKKKLTEHLNKTECGNFGQPTAHYVVKRAKFR